MSNSPITTHVLDTALGRPGVGIAVQLEQLELTGAWQKIGSGKTNDDGRLTDLLQSQLEAARYRISFDTKAYFSKQGTSAFYPTVSIEFDVVAADEHYHVPLLLSPFGYSTYRGS